MPIITNTTTIAASATSSASISLDVIKENTWVSFSVRGGNSNPGDSMVTFTLTNTSLVFNRQTAGTNTLVISYAVVSSPLLTVQHFSGTVTATPTDIPITAVNTAQTFVQGHAATNGSSFTQDEGLRFDLTSNTQVRITCAATPSTQYNLQVVSSTLFSVQKGSFSFPSGSGTQRNIAISAVDTAKTFLIGSNQFGSSNTSRLHEKCVMFSLSSTTNILVERTGVTTTNDGIVFAVTLSGSCSVSHSGLITFTSSTTPTSPSGTFAGSTAFNKTIPWLGIAPYGYYAVNDITSDDNSNRSCVTAVLNSVSSGSACEIAFQKGAATDVVRLHAALIFLPDFDTSSPTTLDVLGLQNDQSSIIVRAHAVINGLGLQEDRSSIATRGSLNLSLVALQSNLSDIASRAVLSLNQLGLQQNISALELRAKLNIELQSVQNELSDIQLRAILPIEVLESQRNLSVIGLRAKLDLDILSESNNIAQINLRSVLGLDVVGRQSNLSNIVIDVGGNGLFLTSISYQGSSIVLAGKIELNLDSVQNELSNIELRAILKLELQSAQNNLSNINLRALSKLNLLSIQEELSVINNGKFEVIGKQQNVSSIFIAGLKTEVYTVLVRSTDAKGRITDGSL
jgi:hypothetical protein